MFEMLHLFLVNVMLLELEITTVTILTTLLPATVQEMSLLAHAA